MQRSMLFTLIVGCCVAVAFAGEFKEDEAVKDGARQAKLRGLARFGGVSGDAPEDKYVPAPKPAEAKVFSPYTKNLKAIGGGKPRLTDQYRRHGYVPLAPSVLPVEHPVLPNGKLTAEAAAKIYRPHGEYQFTTDNL